MTSLECFSFSTVIGARLGTEIRVVGNDSNEKLSIQQGTLARLDRPAPDYGPGRYNDFNTFYLQASSNCSGGSSGSPVLNRHGQAIALNAGANTQSTHSYYLPLDRVVPALQALQNGDRPRRGTVGVEWVWVSLQQAKRLGLKPTEGMAASKGVLVVDRLSSSSVAPVGKDMEVGDMLLEIDKEIVSSFVDLERVLDEHVGQSVLFKLQRGSDDVITVRIDVQEIQEVTELVEWSQAVFHPLSLHLQRHLRPSGDQKMVVAQCGYLLANAGVPSGSILLALDGKQVTHVSSLIDILKELKNGQDVSVKFQPLSFTSPGSHSGSHAGSVKGNERVQTVRMHVDHLENFPFRLGKRNDKEGRWDYQELQATKGNPNVLHQPPPLKANPSLKTNSIGQHLVWIVARSPLTLEGYCQTLFKGTGVIIQGLILCQRSSLVPHACMSIDVYFPHETQSRCGRLVFQHPQFDFCFVQVDTMPATQDQPLPLMDPMCIRQVQPGTCMTLVSLLDAQRTVLTCDVSVDAMCLQQPLASPLIPPRFRSLNSQQMKCVPNAIQESANRNSGSRASEQHLLHSPQTIGRASGGILVHPQQGAVYALWLCSDADTDTEAHGYGMPMTYIYPVLEALRQQRPSVLHRLEVELEQVSIQEVFDQGLKAEDAIGRESLLRVHSVSVLTPTVVEKERGETLEGLEEGDIILSIQQQAVKDVEDLHAFLFGLHTADPILLHIECLRHGRRDSCRQWTSTQVIPRLNLTLNSLPLLPTVPRPVLLGWCGAILMHAYTAVLQQVDRQSLPSPTYPIHEYPYITSVLLGSPCESHHLPSGYFVLEVDGQDTRVGKGQDALTCWQRVFCGQTKKKFVRVKVMHRNGRVRVLSLWLDLHYWPTWIVDQKGSVFYL